MKQAYLFLTEEKFPDV